MVCTVNIKAVAVSDERNFIKGLLLRHVVTNVLLIHSLF